MSKRLYKGKRVIGEGYVVGYHCSIGKTITGAVCPEGVQDYIIPEHTTSLEGAIEVYPKTVAQHTGRDDRNGNSIWSDSFLKVSLREKVRTGNIFYDKSLACYSVKFPDGTIMKLSELFSAKNTEDVWVEVVLISTDDVNL